MLLQGGCLNDLNWARLVHGSNSKQAHEWDGAKYVSHGRCLSSRQDADGWGQFRLKMLGQMFPARLLGVLKAAARDPWFAQEHALASPA